MRSSNCFPRSVGGALLWFPVPLHHSKRGERGFNQAELIAAAAAKMFLAGGMKSRRIF